MEKLREDFAQLQQTITHIMNDKTYLGTLSVTEIDNLISMRNKLDVKCDWQEREERNKSLRSLYISSLPCSKDQLKAFMHWRDDSMGKFKFQDFCKEILAIIHEANNDVLEFVWCMIGKKQLWFSLNQLATLPVTFIAYGLKKTAFNNKISPKNNTAEDDDEYDNMYTRNDNILMEGRERFWVDILATGAFNDHQTDILSCIGRATSPLMKSMPMQCTILEGELISKITEHYKNAKISPMINIRRKLGVTLENTAFSFHEFEEVFNANTTGIFATSLSIEMPYMCYVYVDRVELDIDNVSYLTNCNGKDTSEIAANVPKIYVDVGQDYIAKPYVPYTNKKHTEQHYHDYKPITQIVTQNVPIEQSGPGYHVTVYFGLMAPLVYIYNVRIYGRAISLVGV